MIYIYQIMLNNYAVGKEDRFLILGGDGGKEKRSSCENKGKAMYTKGTLLLLLNYYGIYSGFLLT